MQKIYDWESGNVNPTPSPQLYRCRQYDSQDGKGHQKNKGFRYTRGTHKMDFISQKLYIYSSMFKLESPSTYSPFDTIHLPRPFFPLLKTGFELDNSDAFSVSAIFCFTSSTLVKCFNFRTFSIRKQIKKKCCSG